MEGLQGLLAKFPDQRVLVVGDVMLDEYLRGDVRRISPEAPVPVVELRERRCVPGGAANASANIAGLGAEALLLGVVGPDEAGTRLAAALAAIGISADGLLTDSARPTATKTRIVAHSQQVVRLDHEDRAPLSGELEDRLLRLIEERLGQADICLLSDYDKGVVSPRLAQRLIEKATAQGKAVVADPKGTDPSKYRGATLVKPNLAEAGLLLGREVRSASEVLEAGPRLLDLLGASCVLLTRGAEGMSLFCRDQAPFHVPTRAREVFDVTGAGDTVAATLAVALAAGATLEEAAVLASHAAGIVVGRLGTTAVRLADLREDLGETTP